MKETTFELIDLEERLQTETCQGATICSPLIFLFSIIWFCTTVTICVRP